MNVVDWVKAGGMLVSLAVGGTLWISGEHAELNKNHAPMEKVAMMEASQHVQTIQGWINAARREGPTPYICDAIRAELSELCLEAPTHYMCKGSGPADTMAAAGCR